MPPIFKVNLSRNIGIQPDVRNIFYLTDGTVTEVKFFDSLFNTTSYISNKNVKLIKCEKTGDDEGVSNCLGLIKLAKKYISETPSFKKGYDKVLIVFDLDVYVDSLHLVINEIKNESDIIFAYSNPSFELLLLMCFDKDLSKNLSADEKSKILENGYVGHDRYICHYLKRVYSFDSKNIKSNFLLPASKFSNAITQNVNIYIDKARSNLTCNLPYVLQCIQEDKIDEIKYFSENN